MLREKKVHSKHYGYFYHLLFINHLTPLHTGVSQAPAPTNLQELLKKSKFNKSGKSDLSSLINTLFTAILFANVSDNRSRDLHLTGTLNTKLSCAHPAIYASRYKGY